MKKVVLKLDVYDEKCKQKAMKIASSLPGLDSISMDMKERKLTLIGDIDPVAIVSKLRKVYHTEIISVGPANGPEKKNDEPKKKEEPKVKEEPKKEEPKVKEEPKKKEEPKVKEEPKKEEPKNEAQMIQVTDHANAFHTYPQMQYYPRQHYPYPQYYPTHYYSRSIEEDPNACVIC